MLYLRTPFVVPDLSVVRAPRRFLTGSAVNVIFADGPTVQDHLPVPALTYLDSVTRNFESRIMCVVELGKQGSAPQREVHLDAWPLATGVATPIAAASRPTQRCVPFVARRKGLTVDEVADLDGVSQAVSRHVRAPGRWKSAPAQRNTVVAKVRRHILGGAARRSFRSPGRCARRG